MIWKRNWMKRSWLELEEDEFRRARRRTRRRRRGARGSNRRLFSSAAPMPAVTGRRDVALFIIPCCGMRAAGTCQQSAVHAVRPRHHIRVRVKRRVIQMLMDHGHNHLPAGYRTGCDHRRNILHPVEPVPAARHVIGGPADEPGVGRAESVVAGGTGLRKKLNAAAEACCPWRCPGSHQ